MERKQDHYEWIATYKDGKTFRQFGLDGKEYGTNKIPDRDCLVKFELFADGNSIFKLDIKKGDKLVYRRRTKLRTVGGLGDPRDLPKAPRDIMFIIGKRAEKDVYYYITPIYHYIRFGNELNCVKTHDIETRETHDLVLMGEELKENETSIIK